ncbi:GDP-L-fucose synthase family protein [Methylobacterium phyllosphaerae]
MNQNQHRILLTGGGGMVGKCLLRTAKQKNLHGIYAPTRGQVDLESRAAVRHIVESSRPEVVIHAAAHVGGIHANMSDPYGFLYRNITINFNVIEEARAAGVKRLIFFGSSCMYPRDHAGLLSESDILAAPLEPTNEGYAISKIAGAKACQYIANDPEYIYRTIVPPNLYGPDDNFDPSRSHLIAAIISKLHAAAKNGEKEVEIWGDGTARREFLYADDLAHFILDSLDCLGRFPPILNVGAMEDHSVDDYYRATASIMGYNGDFRYNLDRPVGMKQKLMDSSTARALNWNPKTDLESGLRKTIQSYLEAN